MGASPDRPLSAYVPGAFVWGAFLPDAPLLVLTGWYAIRLWSETPPGTSLFGPEYDALYFGDPVWLVGHNLMHAPLLIAPCAVLGWVLGVRGTRPAWTILYWFALGCGLHSLLDVLTHYDDGPLLLFPFDFDFRLSSPVSYWDPRHFGRPFMLLEHIVNFAAAAAMLRQPAIRWARRLQSNRQNGQTY